MQLPTRRDLLAVIVATIAAIAATTPALAAPTPADATASALLDAFATHQIVALGQVHDLRQEDDFILDLLHHPRFAATVNSIVVEFGNARYQSRVDRYIAGRHISRRALQLAWRDTVGTAPGDHDGAARFYLAVRRLNRTLPRNDRIRMRLGDPAFNWSKLRRASQVFRAGARRDAVFASTADSEARAGRHVLLLSGFGHFLRSAPSGRKTGNALERLERGAPGRVWTVLPYGGVPQQQDDFERRFITALPSIAMQPLTGELGDLPANRFLPRPLIPGPGLALRDLADALISFGPCAHLRFAKLSAAPFRDRAYLRELDRRNRILHGRPFVMPVLPSPNAPYCPGSA
jgi:hypothetical protein